jgi:hypothetical protein
MRLESAINLTQGLAVVTLGVDLEILEKDNQVMSKMIHFYVQRIHILIQAN